MPQPPVRRPIRCGTPPSRAQPVAMPSRLVRSDGSPARRPGSGPRAAPSAHGSLVARLVLAAMLLASGIPGRSSFLHAQERRDSLAVAAPADTGDAVPADTYLDGTAAELHAAAVDNWTWIDETVVRYTSLVRHRFGVSLRTPLKDRTLYRSESASRVFWDRDGEALVQVLAVREQNPAEVEPPDVDGVVDDFFDPAGDRLFFGMGPQDEDPADGDFTFWHPLAPEAGRYYRFRTGDTLTLSFPDGQSVQAVELQALPREEDVHRISGSLWIEPSSGALVRAVYRLADRFDVMRDVQEVQEEEDDLRWVPGVFKPWTFELSRVLVDYGLWDFRVWLPRSMRMEGVARAGVLHAPMSFDVSYRVESVVTEEDLAEERAGASPQGVVEERRFADREEAMRFMASLMGEDEGVEFRLDPSTHRRNGRLVRYLVPEDSSWLHESPHLPPPIWEDAPGFPTERDLAWVEDVLADLPRPSPGRTFWAANWGLQRPDLIRYNRVEGPSVGARLQLRTGSPFGPVSLALVPFLGLADLEPKARLSATWDGVKRQTTLGVYRDLQSAGRRDEHLGLGNSATALLFGRDEGEYFMAMGADLRMGPAEAKRAAWSVRLYAERQRAVDAETDFSLAHAFDGAWSFRPNLDATPQDELGAEVVVSPWWGTDPLAPQAGVEVYVQGATGDLDYGRGSLLLRGAVPFRTGEARWKAAAEVEAGEAWGDVPLQRNWFLGGASSLRGYPASLLAGEAFGRGRLELARVLSGVSVAGFTDAGWTGRALRDLDADEALWSLGVGASVLDGLLRLDVARGLRGPRQTRWDFYLDAPF